MMEVRSSDLSVLQRKATVQTTIANVGRRALADVSNSTRPTKAANWQIKVHKPLHPARQHQDVERAAGAVRTETARLQAVPWKLLTQEEEEEEHSIIQEAEDEHSITPGAFRMAGGLPYVRSDRAEHELLGFIEEIGTIIDGGVKEPHSRDEAECARTQVCRCARDPQSPSPCLPPLCWQTPGANPQNPCVLM